MGTLEMTEEEVNEFVKCDRYYDEEETFVKIILRERGGNMKKINITFSFRDETGDYSVKVFPFVIKCIVSVIVIFDFIVIAMALPGEISDHVKYSGKEYYKSRCEEKYIDREFDSLHDYLNLYHLQEKITGFIGRW